MVHDYLDYLCDGMETFIMDKERGIIAQEIEEYEEVEDSLQKTIELDLY